MGSGVKDGFHLCQNQVLKKSFMYVRFKQSKPRVCFSLRIIKHENTVEEGGILLVYLEIENTYSSTLDILGSSRWFKYLFLKGFCGFLKKKCDHNKLLLQELKVPIFSCITAIVDYIQLLQGPAFIITSSLCTSVLQLFSNKCICRRPFVTEYMIIFMVVL